jgi:hypothetical protein
MSLVLLLVSADTNSKCYMTSHNTASTAVNTAIAAATGTLQAEKASSRGV